MLLWSNSILTVIQCVPRPANNIQSNITICLEKLAVVYSHKFLTNNDVILLLPLTWKTYYLCQQPFYGSLSETTRVSQDKKKHSPTHHPDHHLIFISFFHLLRSISVLTSKLKFDDIVRILSTLVYSDL